MKNLYSDIAPAEGRSALEKWPPGLSSGSLTWDAGDFSLSGELAEMGYGTERTIRVKGAIHPQDRTKPVGGWIELEGLEEPGSPVIDLYLVGTRPWPQPDLTCVCRHPYDKSYLVAATRSSRLLLLENRLAANLNVVAQVKLPIPLVSLVCYGNSLLGLEEYPSNTLQVIELTSNTLAPFVNTGRITLPLTLTALAENDGKSSWGMGQDGSIYLLMLGGKTHSSTSTVSLSGDRVRKTGRLQPKKFGAGHFTSQLKSWHRATKSQGLGLRHLYTSGNWGGFSYDGRNFWAFRHDKKGRSYSLYLYNPDGSLNRSYATWPEVSIASLSYCHNCLLVLDTEHRQLHQYILADTAKPINGWSPHKNCHPGFMSAGTPRSGGIHDLCLLYGGAEGRTRVHRYDCDKLRPLVGYLSSTGAVQGRFMDGFLLLAQYSPLLNGRGFGTDLKGTPSRKEDWLALFNEYFDAQYNLQALEDCTADVNRQLPGSPQITKVVLAIPSADPRCTNWNNQGYSLVDEAHRIQVTAWAMQELLSRWRQAGYRHLELRGFYYMSEQGVWNDPVLHEFPRLCHKYGVRAFAIPGITSSWMTEFNRAGFDCVAFQPSHAFWSPSRRPPHYLLSNAGRIAREFGMGIEVELPYDVLKPSGQQKLRDYLDMASIQGWAGAFKAYFQSYNLIKNLADSTNPACRQLYDDLYRLSQQGRFRQQSPAVLFHDEVPIDWQTNWPAGSGESRFRIRFEGHQGVLELISLSEK